MSLDVVGGEPFASPFGRTHAQRDGDLDGIGDAYDLGGGLSADGAYCNGEYHVGSLDPRMGCLPGT